MTNNFRRNIERVFCSCRDLKTSWLEHFSKFNKRDLWKKISWLEHFLNINKQGRGEKGLIEKNNLGVGNINTSTTRYVLGCNALYRPLTFRSKVDINLIFLLLITILVIKYIKDEKGTICVCFTIFFYYLK